LDVTDAVSSEILSLPLHSDMSAAMLNRVVEAIGDFFAKTSSAPARLSHAT
jgi:dTDP-4-amino-4,6-dideoxygalactose transaminase